MADLTDKQKRFCEEYMIDLNATQAAIRAGYSERTAYSIGDENLRKPEISKHIQFLQSARSERTQIDADWVLARFKEISDRCMQKSPVMIRQGRDIVQKIDEEGNHVWEFDSTGANRATELIGKHIGWFETDNKQKKNDPLPQDVLIGLVNKINNNAAS